MVTYISLSTFTDQGIRDIKNTTQRAEDVKAAAKKFGCNMTQLYWTLGEYDLVAVTEGPSDEAITAFALAIGKNGNVRMQSLRAFNKDEMNGILSKMG